MNLLRHRQLSLRIAIALAAFASVVGYSPLATAAHQQSPPDQDSQTPKTSKAKTLQTVIVTAERRRQNLQSVPSAVSALNSSQLQRRGINNVSDLTSQAPGLIVNQGVSSSAVAIGMRGTYIADPSLFINSPVAIFVDGVYYGKTNGAVFDLTDLERIEMLRGPQGTLYGRNAFAGAINFITHTPSGIFNGRAEIDAGNFGYGQGKFAMDLPAMGKFKVSLGGLIDRRHGWVSTTPGSSVSQLNNVHKQSGFVDVLFDPTNNFSINYRLDYHDQNQYPPYNQTIQSDVEDIFGIPGIYATSGRQMKGGVDGPVAQRMHMAGQALTATWHVNDHNTLKYIYGHRSMRYIQNLDLDGTALPFASTGLNNTYLLTSSELQWLGSSGAFDWVMGLYRFNDTGTAINPQSFFFGADNVDLFYGFATSSRAVYGQGNYHVTDRLTLTIGARRTVDHIVGYESQSAPNVDVPFFRGTTSSSATTPMASVSYQLADNVMVYGRYAVGYNGGGFNGQATSVEAAHTPYEPEKKYSYELGVKSTFHDKYRLNADVYWERNTNLQETVAFAGASGTTGTTIENAGKSHDEGVELEGTAVVSPRLRLNASLAYSHVKYDEFLVLGVNEAGNQAVQGAPKYTLNLSADTTIADTPIGVLRGFAQYSFVSTYYPIELPFVPPPGQASAYDGRTPSAGLLDLRLSLGGLDLGHNLSGEVALWVRNAFNRAYTTFRIPFGPDFGNLTVGNYNIPRTFGASFTASW